MIKASGLSDVGPVRKNNEDSFATDETLQLFVVADGMGGHSAGEIASKLAVETIVSFVRRSEEDTDLSWPYGVDSNLSFCGNRLRTAIHLANRRVFRAAEKHDEYTGMGTTVVGALISGSRLSVGHAGDSRLYVFRDGALTRLTTDDTWAATVVGGKPESDPSRPGAHPMRHVLTSVLGVQDHVDVHMTELDLHGGEMILMCSDGLHNVVDDNALREVLTHNAVPSSIVSQLIQMALTGGGRDNVTAVVARYDGE
jgi:serine/threonine protein phosphatase PrpC